MTESEGTKIARELRAECNKLTVEERQMYYDKGMSIILASRQTGKIEAQRVFIEDRLKKMGL